MSDCITAKRVGAGGSSPVRIVLTGSECTGKSTLGAMLAEHYGVPYVEEYLREYFIANDGVLTLEDAVPIAKGQLKAELAVETQEPRFLLCDTNMLSSAVYNKYYYGTNPEWIESALLQREYTLYLLCGVDIPWEDDGQRDRPEEREYMQGLFQKELEDRNLAFVKIQGTRQERFARAVEAIDVILSAAN
ncbi:AAA family ATPase [Halodesulfovibrio marinisediminis]|uniref:Nicotinamide riboside kinase n=1 Tax=Halodesulfovibrio marinisediminis DSM 17456 TaxID=1121457 RepID=A0A1N6DTT4_9BACT|nr:ATP-binding protein [Halodesulfovibrio marinisediminis]SIN74104.1 Nicotinamide riboside kinase [Halodesulfovibrio marinisediminis DSM 17456]